MSDAENRPETEAQEGAQPASATKTFIEELEVAGNQLVKEVERLVREGNVRRLIIKRDNEVIFQTNLTLGVAGAGAVAIFAPIPAVLLGVIAALAAVVSRVTVVIERVEPPDIG